jgi:hypothetical protein
MPHQLHRPRIREAVTNVTDWLTDWMLAHRLTDDAAAERLGITPTQLLSARAEGVPLRLADAWATRLNLTSIERDRLRLLAAYDHTPVPVLVYLAQLCDDLTTEPPSPAPFDLAAVNAELQVANDDGFGAMLDEIYQSTDYRRWLTDRQHDERTS